MNQTDYTARELLEIKSSLIYTILLCLITIIAITFMFVSNVRILNILRPLLINLIAISMAVWIYNRKKKKLSAAVQSWIVGFVTCSIPFLAKYSYASDNGWTFAAQSYNSSILLILFLIGLQLLYRPRMYLFFMGFSFINWVIFIVLAYQNDANFHLYAVDNGKPVLDGVIILREVFFIIVAMILSYVVYLTMPIVREYDELSTEQKGTIQLQSEVQKEIAREIREKMAVLLEQVDEQNQSINRFNEKMQNQAATFEEVSSTLEELFASAENIHTSSVSQVDGNVKMETIVNEFKQIKLETKANLGATFENIEAVVDRTSHSNQKLIEVETTISEIEQQSSRISETIALIVDIADRINLLSLNAAIEAARAGDSGKGFAVVADEIGKLAYQTQESIKEIEEVLRNSNATTSEGVAVIKDTADLIKELIGNMNESSDKIKILQESIMVEEKYINVIIEQMFSNIELARNIGTGTDEQKTALHNTTDAIEHVNELLGEMVTEIRNLTDTSNTILKNATELMERSKDAV